MSDFMSASPGRSVGSAEGQEEIRMRAASAGCAGCCVLLGAAVGMGGEMARAQAKAAPVPHTRLLQNAVVALDHGWQFRQIMSGAEQVQNGWIPCTVPGDVHLDLLAN